MGKVMTASTFGAAFDKLPAETRDGIFKQLKIRRLLYQTALGRGYYSEPRIVILGDTPGPGRPDTDGYHHTPFYSTKNSSLWVNKQLVEAGIDESQLLWFNTTLADGSSLDPIHIFDLARYSPAIICLGGNAEKWVRRNVPTSKYVKVFHPQFAKRFRPTEPYALIDEIKKVLL